MTRRRSRLREAQARRAEQQRKADRAIRNVTHAATAAVLVAFAIVIVAVLEGPSGFGRVAEVAAQPVLGPLSLGSLFILIFGVWIAIAIWLKLRK